MKTILLIGGSILLLNSCVDSPEAKFEENLSVEDLKSDVAVENIPFETDSIDTVIPEIVEPVPPPPTPPPVPLPPDPWPEPEPEPWPPEPMPYPEPVPPPHPAPVQNPVVDFPDVEPRYPGDSREDASHMIKFINDNIKYPEIDLEEGNQGRVFVEFIVEKDGNLTNIKVLRGVSALIDREAKRIIRLMPNWTPGEVGGKAVRTRARLPITFRLD